ncbi:MAG: 6,7-dimethyl-8-ribityllumazine synthase [Bacteroidota bacterium]|nr:6,7-dimethyl-8-ribityllumazine synthase [Bacteroidota bacterium]
MATANNNLSKYDVSRVPDGKNSRIALVVSEWNKEITEALFQGAKNTLINHNVLNKNIVRIDVPGSFELIYGANSAQRMDFDAIIAIGCIIQGETRHFEFISNAVAQGIKDLNINGKAPVVFCVLTDETIEQSIARSGGDKGNKGVEAAFTALRMTSL